MHVYKSCLMQPRPFIRRALRLFLNECINGDIRTCKMQLRLFLSCCWVPYHQSPCALVFYGCRRNARKHDQTTLSCGQHLYAAVSTKLFIRRQHQPMQLLVMGNQTCTSFDHQTVLIQNRGELTDSALPVPLLENLVSPVLQPDNMFISERSLHF